MHPSYHRRANIVLTELKNYFPHSHTVLEFSTPIELLFAVMLSAQTTDKQVNVVTRTVFNKYPTLTHYVNADDALFTEDIRAINYYKTKSKHILATARILDSKFEGTLPKTLEEMLTLPGVGRKTALVVLGNAYNITEGIAVDTHVQRLSNVFKLTKHTQPEKIEEDLKKLFPKDEWFHLTNRMIDYGRMYCPARCAHEDCPIVQILKKNRLY